MLSNSIKVKTLCGLSKASNGKKMTMTLLAKELGCSRQQFYRKIALNTLSEEEMHRIAEICGVKYRSEFVFEDGTVL